jgi:hypothetical protein
MTAKQTTSTAFQQWAQNIAVGEHNRHLDGMIGLADFWVREIEDHREDADEHIQIFYTIIAGGWKGAHTFLVSTLGTREQDYRQAFSKARALYTAQQEFDDALEEMMSELFARMFLGE